MGRRRAGTVFLYTCIRFLKKSEDAMGAGVEPQNFPSPGTPVGALIYKSADAGRWCPSIDRKMMDDMDGHA